MGTVHKLRPTEGRACRRCRQCGAPFDFVGVTCGQSECQEAEYHANAERAKLGKRAFRAAIAKATGGK